MNINKFIQWSLEQGYTVHSKAIGRVGKVTSTEGDLVYIEHNKQPGVTSFMLGDPVKLDIDPMKREVLIQNTGTSK